MVMTETVISEVKRQMQAEGLSQGELSRRIGIERPNLTRMFSGRVGRVPDNWQKVLDALGLELTVQKKSGEHG